MQSPPLLRQVPTEVSSLIMTHLYTAAVEISQFGALELALTQGVLKTTDLV